ncbi:MAG: dTDP-4-dehydrorhamnose reductase [Pontimonas sp.]|jgi:dTDP-4-dehydrorhamnose reductase
MKALILGASGFLGSYAGYALIKQGWQLTGVSRAETSLYSRHHAIDSLAEVPGILRSHPWDVVLNCVAMASHEQCEARPGEARTINADIPARWAGIAADVGATFVHVSTDAVFSGSRDELYAEDDDTAPHSVYGKTKRRGEEAVLHENPHSLVLRTNFFGWSQNSSKGILDFFATGVENQQSMTGFTDYVVSSLYMSDVWDLLVEVVEKNASGIYHLTSSTPLSKYAFGLAVAEALGGDETVISAGVLSESTSLGNRGHNLGLSVAKLETLVGHPVPGTLSGIARAVKERDAVMDYFGSTHREGKAG